MTINKLRKRIKIYNKFVFNVQRLQWVLSSMMTTFVCHKIVSYHNISNDFPLGKRHKLTEIYSCFPVNVIRTSKKKMCNILRFQNQKLDVSTVFGINMTKFSRTFRVYFTCKHCCILSLIGYNEKSHFIYNGLCYINLILVLCKIQCVLDKFICVILLGNKP